MFPFQPPASTNFMFSFSNIGQVCPSPISDIESETKSVNGDLCQSFEGLFKKQEQEESTRSSEWSEKEKFMAAATKVDAYQQNQNDLKLKKNHKKSQETLANEQTSTSSNQKSYSVEKIQLEQIDQIKQSLLQKRNKLAKYRQKFLSFPCYTKLPEQLLKMLEISQKIDNYLLTKKAAKYTDNIYNIFKTLFSDEEMSTIWSTVKKIMFIVGEHYSIRIDPLKNLCMSLGSKKDTKTQVRKQKLRKLLGEYYFNNKKTYAEHGVPEAYVEPVKTARFYPENLSLSVEMYGKKVSKKFVNRLEESVRQKQQKLQDVQEKCLSCAPATAQYQADQPLPHPTQLEQFCDAISNIYSEKKVLHMYKSSLLQNLRKNTTFSLEKIFFFVKYINKQELFLQVLVKNGCIIFGLREKEKSALIQLLKTKRGD